MTRSCSCASRGGDEQPAGEGGVGGREAPGERRGGEQQHQADDARQVERRRAAVQQVPVDRRPAAGELARVNREGEAHDGQAPDHDRQDDGDQAERQAEQGVADFPQVARDCIIDMVGTIFHR